MGKRKTNVYFTTDETPLDFRTITETMRKDRKTGAFVVGRLIRCYTPDGTLLWEHHEEVAQLWKQ